MIATFPLSLFMIFAAPAQIEVINVGVTGSSVFSRTVLQLGVPYEVRASGTFFIGGPGDGLADAEYANFLSPLDFTSNGIDLGLAIDDCVVDGDRVHRWGPYRPDHAYSQVVVGMGAPIKLMYHDSTYTDNIGALRVEIHLSTDPWTDLGFALPGTYGEPLLAASGTLLPGDLTILALTNALENTVSFFILGFSSLDVPFAGGTLVPAIDFVVLLPTDMLGGLTLTTTALGTLPGGTDIYFQHWIRDTGAPVGLSASNAIRGTVP